MSIRAAQNLQKYGIKMGDITCIVTNNAPFSVPIVVACDMIGSPLLILSPNYEDDEITLLLKLTNAKIIFCDDFAIEKVQKIKVENEIGGNLVSLIDKVDGFDYVEQFLEATGHENDFV